MMNKLAVVPSHNSIVPVTKPTQQNAQLPLKGTNPSEPKIYVSNEGMKFLEDINLEINRKKEQKEQEHKQLQEVHFKSSMVEKKKRVFEEATRVAREDMAFAAFFSQKMPEINYKKQSSIGKFRNPLSKDPIIESPIPTLTQVEIPGGQSPFHQDESLLDVTRDYFPGESSGRVIIHRKADQKKPKTRKDVVVSISSEPKMAKIHSEHPEPNSGFQGLLRGMMHTKSAVESGENSKYSKSVALSSKEKSKFQLAIQSLYRTSTEHNGSPRSSGMGSPRKNTKRLIINRNRGLDLPAPQLVLEGIKNLEMKAIQHGEQIKKQVSKRLDDLKQFVLQKDGKLSANCHKEFSQLQRIGQLLHLHTMTEEKYQKRLEDERRAREERAEEKIDAGSLLCSAKKAGQEFALIGDQIRYFAKGSLHKVMVRDAIRKLHQQDPEVSEVSLMNGYSSRHLRSRPSYYESADSVPHRIFKVEAFGSPSQTKVPLGEQSKISGSQASTSRIR